MNSNHLENVLISVSPRSEYVDARALFDALETIFPVCFQGCEISDIPHRGAAVLIGESLDRTLELATKGVRCYRVPNRSVSSIQASGRIEFSSSRMIHRGFRACKVSDPSITTMAAPVDVTGDVLASLDNHPVWSVLESGTGSVQLVGVHFPVIAPTEPLRRHFLTSKWFRLLPLLHFLRAETESMRLSRPESQACFIIDDPNLHSTRYGYVDFEVLAQHARTHQYHAAIATVPLDTWRVNNKAASIFRENAERISILIHGINHTKNELAYSEDLREMRRQLAMGLSRMRRFEHRSGISVSKIMVPPHGALSVDVASTMGELGYEAGCVSYGSLLHLNPDKKWAADFGFALGQFVGPSSFPIVHRITLDEVDLRLCAFLEHPIVLTSHHYDLSSGMEKFQALSRLINSFGSISWTNMTGISRSNYLTKKQGSTLHVKPYARKIALNLSEDILRLSFSLPWSPLAISLEREAKGIFRNPDPENSIPIVLQEVPHGILEVSFPQTGSHPVTPVRIEKPAMWPVVRRVLTEGRDRLWPRLQLRN